MSSAIRFIAETVSSDELIGPRKYFGIITSTKTGRSLVVADVGGVGNLRAVIAACFDAETAAFPTTYCVDSVLPVREWRARAKRLSGVAVSLVTCELIEELER